MAIAIIAILALMLLPCPRQVQDQAHGIKCVSYSRQLALARVMYADGHGDKLPPNVDGSARGGWVGGWIHPTQGPVNLNAASNVSLLKPTNGLLHP
ncbi:MAG: hypothetical protein ACKVYV_08490 [Limisphaerales bacterium]